MLGRKEHRLHRHNHNGQERTLPPYYLISAMGNKLVSLVGISTSMQYSKSSQDQTPSGSSSVPFLTTIECAICVPLCHQGETGCVLRGESPEWGDSPCRCLRHCFRANHLSSERLVNPQNHELRGCPAPSFLTVLLFCEFSHENYQGWNLRSENSPELASLSISFLLPFFLSSTIMSINESNLINNKV